MNGPTYRIRGGSVDCLPAMPRTAYPIIVGLVVVASLATSLLRAADPLPSWNETPTKQAIITFVEKVTAQGSNEFVPPVDRIATFDNDGTLWSEQPMYFQLAFVMDRVKDLAPRHPEWQTS